MNERATMAKTTITVRGNLARDVETKISKAGKSYYTLSVGSTPSKKNAAGEWENGETMWFAVTAFEEVNPFEFVKGAPVEVTGTFTVRNYVKNDGTPGYSLDILANTITTVAKNTPVSAQASAAAGDWDKPTVYAPAPTLVEEMPF